MSIEISLKELFEIILLVVVLLVPSGAAIGYLSPDFPKLKLISYELKNTHNLMSASNFDEMIIDYDTNDKEIEIEKKKDLLIIRKKKASITKEIFNSNIKIDKDKTGTKTKLYYNIE